MSSVAEASMTDVTIGAEAIDARYYSYEEHCWKTICLPERLFRQVFGTLFDPWIDNVERTCQRRSWRSVERMPTIPGGIKAQALRLLLDSRSHTNPISSYAQSISRIYCKVARESGQYFKEIDLQQSPKCSRSFGIFQGKSLSYLVGSTAFGKLDFYLPERQRVFSNSFDTLYDRSSNRIAGIKLAVDYPRLQNALQIVSGSDQPLISVDDSKERTSLVFREAMSNRLLAVANKSDSRAIHWTLTIIDDKLDVTQSILLTWAILKYSQHYHFSAPYYRTTPPKPFSKELYSK